MDLLQGEFVSVVIVIVDKSLNSSRSLNVSLRKTTSIIIKKLVIVLIFGMLVYITT